MKKKMNLVAMSALLLTVGCATNRDGHLKMREAAKSKDYAKAVSIVKEDEFFKDENIPVTLFKIFLILNAVNRLKVYTLVIGGLVNLLVFQRKFNIVYAVRKVGVVLHRNIQKDVVVHDIYIVQVKSEF